VVTPVYKPFVFVIVKSTHSNPELLKNLGNVVSAAGAEAWQINKPHPFNTIS
jgi:hypothetical protein